jgi:hypothetical protein
MICIKGVFGRLKTIRGTNIIIMFSEVDLPINDTENDKVQIFEKSKFSPIINFRAEIGLLNQIQNTIYGI